MPSGKRMHMCDVHAGAIAAWIEEAGPRIAIINERGPVYLWFGAKSLRPIVAVASILAGSSATERFLQ